MGSHKDPNFLHADSKDSDQTGRMPRLIWVFAGRTCHFVGFVMRQLERPYKHWVSEMPVFRQQPESADFYHTFGFGDKVIYWYTGFTI